MIVTTITDRRHTLHFEGLPDDGFVFENSAETERVLLASLVVTVIVDGDNWVRPLEVEWSGSGVLMLNDGTRGKAVRKPRGSNLNRLPGDLREIVLSAIEGLGGKGLREDLDRMLTPSQRARLDTRD